MDSGQWTDMPTALPHWPLLTGHWPLPTVHRPRYPLAMEQESDAFTNDQQALLPHQRRAAGGTKRPLAACAHLIAIEKLTNIQPRRETKTNTFHLRAYII